MLDTATRGFVAAVGALMQLHPRLEHRPDDISNLLALAFDDLVEARSLLAEHGDLALGVFRYSDDSLGCRVGPMTPGFMAECVNQEPKPTAVFAVSLRRAEAVRQQMAADGCEVGPPAGTRLH